jgi:predicted alpha/beta hydrolase family esterase
VKTNRGFAIYQSTDDPLIPVAEARFVASQLKCSYFEFEDRGHFVDQNDFPKWCVSCARESRARIEAAVFSAVKLAPPLPPINCGVDR